jgi:hypothetical protein
LEITDSFIDEANQVTDKAKNIVKSRIRFRLDDYNLIPKQLYTCNPAKNWTYSEFYKPDRDAELEPNKKFIQSLVDDNPFISKHYKQNLLTLDKESKERLLFGNWEYLSDPSSLIDYDKIINSFSNDFVSSGDKYITCDVARFGNDSTVIGVWSGYRVKVYRYSKKSIVEVAQIVRQLMAENSVPISNVLLDEDGVGGGAVDILNCRGFVNNSSPLENPISRTKDNFDNLKSQCYFKLAEKINSDEIFIDCPSNFKQMIVEELEQIKQKSVDNDAKKGIIPKDKVKQLIGRSPDFSDMLAMRTWFEFKPKFVVGVW